MSAAKDEKPTVVEAMAAVMEDVRAVAKGDRNTQQNYQFRGIDAVINAVGPIFRKHHVVPMPVLESVNYRDVQTSNGKPSRECTVTVRYRFFGPAGDSIDAVTPGESMDFGDKGAPKAMSVAYRIALLQALCLPTDDTDPDAESYERGNPAPPAQRNGHQQRPGPDPKVKAATDALRVKCAKEGWDQHKVADRFLRQYGQELRDATDATRIEAFTKLIEKDSADVKVAEPAGAPS